MRQHHIADGPAFKATKITLNQITVQMKWRLRGLGDDLRRLGCAQQRAADDYGWQGKLEFFGNSLCLGNAKRVQRNISSALKHAPSVPVSQAMAQEQKRAVWHFCSRPFAQPLYGSAANPSPNPVKSTGIPIPSSGVWNTMNVADLPAPSALTMVSSRITSA